MSKENAMFERYGALYAIGIYKKPHGVIEVLSVAPGRFSNGAVLRHSEARELALAILALVDRENPVKVKETGMSWQHAAAQSIYAYAIQLGLDTVYDGVICKFEDIICSHQPFRHEPNPDWIEAAAYEIDITEQYSKPSESCGPSVEEIIRKHAPKP